MNLLKNELTKQVPVIENDIKKLISEKGNEKFANMWVESIKSNISN